MTPSTRRMSLPHFDLSGSLWEPLHRLRGEVDRPFEDAVSFPSMTPAARRLFGMAVPPLSMSRTSDGYELTAELPGLEPSQVDISISGDVIRITGEKKESSERKESDYFLSERHYGAFERAVELPPDADRDTVDASFKNGVLTIRMKRDVKAPPAERKIETKSA